MEVCDRLYEGFLFQSGRFRRLAGYRRLASTSCDAEIERAGPGRWFHRYLPGRLVLGDPAARDAAIHAVQACIPQAVVLPVGLERLVPGTVHDTSRGRALAGERCDLGDLLIYDIDVVDERGEVRERWEGLHLRVVERREPSGDWPDALLGPYLERRLRTLASGARPSTSASAKRAIQCSGDCSVPRQRSGGAPTAGPSPTPAVPSRRRMPEGGRLPVPRQGPSPATSNRWPRDRN